jgi:hypothetical protein
MAVLAIPGIGPILAVGPLAAGIMGAGLGAAAGGIAGALKSHGVPEAEAAKYSSAVQRGGVLVSVHAHDTEVDQAADILEESGAINVEEPGDTVGGTRTQFKPLPPDAEVAAKLTAETSVREKQRERERRVSVYPGITGGGPTVTS